MHTRKVLSSAIALALLAPAMANAIEISGYVKNETAVFTKDGQVTGAASSVLDNSNSHDAGDLLKFENSARFFINGELGEKASWHADINVVYDTEGNDTGSVDYKGYELYSQQDWLRELYVDTSLAGWLIRLGKQQVVWGTADGIKLLDIINPTDFRELNQNTMEDSRIPIWMLNAERNVGNNGNIQFIVSQAEENKIPGLNKGGDSGHPFIMKGVDTITGQVNGFLNIAPNLANVAGSFTNATFIPAFPDGMGGTNPNPLYNPFGNGLVPFAGFTVDGFASSPSMMPLGNTWGYEDLNALAQFGFSTPDGSVIDPNGNFFATNLMPATGPAPTDVNWSPSNPTSAFENMSLATFATFNTFSTFVGNDPSTGLPYYTGATSKYRRDYPEDTDVNGGFRWKQFLDNGLSYSLNYFYHYSSNPDIELSWRDSVTGAALTEQLAPAADLGGGFYAPNFGVSLSADELPTNLTSQLPATVLLHNDAGEYYGAADPTGGMGAYNSNPVELMFTESLHRMHSFGASFDYALDTAFAPVVLRGEFLYDKDDRQPVIDRKLLNTGALASSLKMEEADYFKYVLGVDITVMTNLLISGQFIQFRNLDFVNNGGSCTTQAGNSVNCGKYTADFATMHLDNDLNKGYENKEFYSLFFSKPFGESQRGRWNNITIYEEGGGWWNRFDVEYSFSDNLVGSFEWNNYWGDEDTTFGQFDKSSNVQVGVKYLFD